jgi:hypothetical protein
MRAFEGYTCAPSEGYTCAPSEGYTCAPSEGYTCEPTPQLTQNELNTAYKDRSWHQRQKLHVRASPCFRRLRKRALYSFQRLRMRAPASETTFRHSLYFSLRPKTKQASLRQRLHRRIPRFVYLPDHARAHLRQKLGFCCSLRSKLVYHCCRADRGT